MGYGVCASKKLKNQTQEDLKTIYKNDLIEHLTKIFACVGNYDFCSGSSCRDCFCNNPNFKNKIKDKAREIIPEYHYENDVNCDKVEFLAALTYGPIPKELEKDEYITNLIAALRGDEKRRSTSPSANDILCNPLDTIKTVIDEKEIEATIDHLYVNESGVAYVCKPFFVFTNKDIDKTVTVIKKEEDK